MSRYLSHFVLAAVLLGPATAAAQTPQAQGVPVAAPAAQATPVVVVDQDAQQTIWQLQQVLRQYPPSVAQVLRLDHSLINRPDYMAAYPALAAFLARHPDVARNPSYYFGVTRDVPVGSAVGVAAEVRNIMQVFFGLSAFLIGFLIVAWLSKQVIDYWRWQRLANAQKEIHNKLMDRLTNNEELLAYLESPTGRRFFEGASLPADSRASQQVGAPVNRILWSIQAGVVLIIVGGAILGLSPTFDDADVVQASLVLGVVISALGGGFVISALISWALSIRLGLMGRAQS